MMFNVNFQVSKDSEMIFQNFCVESNSVDELFEKIKSLISLIDGVVDNITISQHILKQRFEKREKSKEEK